MKWEERSAQTQEKEEKEEKEEEIENGLKAHQSVE